MLKDLSKVSLAFLELHIDFVRLEQILFNFVSSCIDSIVRLSHPLLHQPVLLNDLLQSLVNLIVFLFVLLELLLI
jgi:hypothetical protein